MKKIVNLIMFISIVGLTACGGRTPSPVMISQYGDQNKNCKALEFEMTNIQSEIQRLLPKTDKTGKNVALGVAGYFLLVPLFFMDFKNAEAVEYEAYRQRYNHLASVAMSKDCSAEVIDLPSIQEMKEEHEKQNAKEKKAVND